MIQKPKPTAKSSKPLSYSRGRRMGKPCVYRCFFFVAFRYCHHYHWHWIKKKQVQIIWRVRGGVICVDTNTCRQFSPQSLLTWVHRRGGCQVFVTCSFLGGKKQDLKYPHALVKAANGDTRRGSVPLYAVFTSVLLPYSFYSPPLALNVWVRRERNEATISTTQK